MNRSWLLVLLACAAAAPLQAQAVTPASTPPSAAPAPPARPPEGFVVQTADGASRLQVRGYVHFDGRFFPDDGGARATDAFLLRRVRPIFSGVLARRFEFLLMPDFGNGTAVVQDAWMEFEGGEAFRVRAGKFKSPVGLERLQSATALAFAERAFPTSLVPNRDVGVQVHGRAGRLQYAAGIFDGAPDGGSVDTDAEDGKDMAARVILTPFGQLGAGVAAVTGRPSGPASGYRSLGQVTVFSYAAGVVAGGRRTRVSPQLSWYTGPLGLTAEYAWSSAHLRAAAPGSAVHRVEHRGWQATATWVLTGQRRSASGVRLDEEFDPAHGRWGALELSARATGLELDDDAFAAGLADRARSVRRARAFGVGLGWWMGRHARQMVSFERTTFTGGAASGDRPAESAVFLRSQISF